ncbi:MAG TPA: hypothetical protein VG944_04265, partial [Fimbriimonas sp.]|nr:hypothetical protein [Fimbriimonas sp.]
MRSAFAQDNFPDTPANHRAYEAITSLGGPEDWYRLLLGQTSYEQVAQTYRDVSALGSRLTGSKGESATFDYVQARLAELGARSITRTPFTVSVPDPQATGTLSVGSASSAVYPLWPNLVRTSTCNVSGPLIYAGRARLEDLNGLDIKGSIAVAEFDSGSNWRNLAKLGAVGIVFIQPTSMARAEAEAKFASVPLEIPRFYLPSKAAGPILSAAFAHQVGHLSCRQDWVRRTSCNLSASFSGSDPSLASHPIVLMAYSDSMSIVPGLCPGAESIGGVAGLLEVARVYSICTHKRPLQVILSGSHSLALRGSREYVEELLHQGGAPLLVVSLDLSSGSTSIGSYGR